MEAIGIAIIAAVGAITVVGQVARRRLARRYPPTGRLVDVGGYRLHIDVRGSGPTVVLEGGTWASGAAWAHIQRDLSAVARVVTYDRAGLGWSDPSPRSRTSDTMADELHELLVRAQVPAPYILVGHSFGGSIVRVFAHDHPELVAGLVLLDGAHEDQFLRAPASVRQFMARSAKAMPVLLAALGLVARAGILALRPTLIPQSATLPDDVASVVRAQVASDPKVLHAMAAEIALLETGNDRLRRLNIRSLGDIPVRVVSHGRAEGTPPQLGPQVAGDYERVWQELQVAQAALSTNALRVVADGIGHDIPGEAPGLVVDTVRGLLPRWTQGPATEPRATQAAAVTLGTSAGMPVAMS